MILLSYLVGSIPTAVIAGRMVLKDDIRRHGSKNAGATNVFRVLGWKPALIVLLIDIGKGIFSTLVIARLASGDVPLSGLNVQMLAGFAAILGHIWTVFAGFRGGKGVGTAFGVLLSLAPWASLVTLIVWLTLVVHTRIVSLGSLAAGIVFPVALLIQKWAFQPGLPVSLIVMGMVLGVLVFITHRSNIGRLIRKEENRFGSKGKEAPDPDKGKE